MPSVVLPFGSPDDLLPGDPNLSKDGVTPHFNGNVNFDVDYTAATEAHTSLTSPDALSTPDTASYAHADNEGFTAAMLGYGLTEPPYFLSTKARQDDGFTLPTAAQDVSLDMIATIRASSPVTQTGLTIYAYDATTGRRVYNGTSGRESVNVGAAQWMTVTLPDKNFRPSLVPNLRSWLAGRRLVIHTAPFGDLSTASWFDVAYFALRVTWRTRGLAPLRQFPRDDELGMASAARHWPSSSEQNSLRRLGGYY